MSNFITLEDVLAKDSAALAELRKGQIESDRLGTIPVTALEQPEYKQAKRDCIKMVPNGTGGMVPEIDDDKLMVKVVIAAVDKDQRSNFTFANKALLEKLGVGTAEQAVQKLLYPGEISKAAIVVQELSGFGQKAAKEVTDAVKNS